MHCKIVQPEIDKILGKYISVAMKEISIIIPVYNSIQYLEECVNSLYRQGISRENFEVIIIDDGSTDNSLLLARALSKKYGNIRVFTQKNQGQAVARNFGLDVMQGKYLMFVDSDDYLLDNGIKCLYQAILNFNLDVVFGLWDEEDRNKKIEKKNSKKFTPNIVYKGEDLALKYPIFGSVCGGLYKRDVFKDLRFEKEFVHEDSELCFRLFPKVNRVMLVEQSVYFYRYNPISTDRDRSETKLLRNIESDAMIASKIFQNITSDIFNEAISRKYKRIANSMVLSYFFQLRRHKLTNTENFNVKLTEWRDLGVYPINGFCNSLLSTITAQLLNIPFVLKRFLCE